MHLMHTNQQPIVGYRIIPDAAALVATKVSTAGGLASRYAQLAAAGIPHEDGVDPLVVVGEVEDCLRARLGRQPTQPEVEAAIEH